MPRFPKKKAEIAALAERLWPGLWDNVATAILSACRDAQAGETDLSACGHLPTAPVCRAGTGRPAGQADAQADIAL